MLSDYCLERHPEGWFVTYRGDKIHRLCHWDVFQWLAEEMFMDWWHSRQSW